LKALQAIRIEVDEGSNKDLATKLLESRAADDPEKTTFPKGCEVESFSQDYFPNACK